ncbi:MAG TPA: YihY/virulence factor BrkB family protein [Solirubrobacteraceae bacterium]|nr:YihY/virulence factor BrkB family protein [Solirubrobacteraceae bacterium]
MTAPASPTDLGKRSWFGTLKRVVSEFRDDNLTDWAAALTYYAVLSIFPAFIAMISILGLVVDPATITRVVTDVVTQLGPESAADTFAGPIEQIAGNRSTALVGLIFGVAVAIWTASNYVGAFMRASNAVYEREEGRPFWKLRPLQLGVTLVLVLLAALVVLALIVTGPVAQAIGDAVGLGDAAVTAWNIAKWPVLLVVVMLMLAILYWSSPNAKQAGFRWVSPGSVVAVVVWIVASAGFAFYVASFSSYNKTYGALAGVIVFLVWMWITNIAVLLGAELNAETERAREIEAGVPGAEEDIKAPYRDVPKEERERVGNH